MTAASMAREYPARHSRAWTAPNLPKPAWIAIMVLGFIVFWPIGLAIPGLPAVHRPARRLQRFRRLEQLQEQDAPRSVHRQRCLRRISRRNPAPAGRRAPRVRHVHGPPAARQGTRPNSTSSCRNATAAAIPATPTTPAMARTARTENRPRPDTPPNSARSNAQPLLPLPPPRRPGSAQTGPFLWPDLTPPAPIPTVRCKAAPVETARLRWPG